MEQTGLMVLTERMVLMVQMDLMAPAERMVLMAQMGKMVPMQIWHTLLLWKQELLV